MGDKFSQFENWYYLSQTGMKQIFIRETEKKYSFHQNSLTPGILFSFLFCKIGQIFSMRLRNSEKLKFNISCPEGGGFKSQQMAASIVHIVITTKLTYLTYELSTNQRTVSDTTDQ